MSPQTILVHAFFAPGRLVATPAAMEKLSPVDMTNALSRHLSGDWGDLDPEDKHQNDLALTTTGARLLSAYPLPVPAAPGRNFWIITEAADETGHRECTTFLLPEDY